MCACVVMVMDVDCMNGCEDIAKVWVGVMEVKKERGQKVLVVFCL